MTALFLNHRQQRCGVYQMGRRIGLALSDAGVVTYCEAAELATAIEAATSQRPGAIIYNWHPATMPWAAELTRRLPKTKHIGLIHEIAPDAPATGSDLFPYRVVCDPSFPVDNVSLFRSVRHIPRYEGEGARNEVFTVGSFGFAVGGKMFPTIVHAVGAEFPGAIVRLHIPRAFYGDDAGVLARRASAASRAVMPGGVRVEVSHEFLEEEELIRWLAGNDLNVFFYEPNAGRGISSVLDYAIAAQQPIAINDSQMFRHVRARLGCHPTRTLRASAQSAGAVTRLHEEWTPERLVLDYRQMLAILRIS